MRIRIDFNDCFGYCIYIKDRQKNFKKVIGLVFYVFDNLIDP